MSIPRVENNSKMATAITIFRDEVVLEPVRVWEDRWVVRRDGRLVLLDQIEPEPDALILIDGFVEDGWRRHWAGLREFLHDHGISITRKEARLAEREGRVRPYRYQRGSVEDSGCDAGVEATLGRGIAA